MPAKQDTREVMFLQTYTVKAADGETYEAGKVYALPTATAQHFMNNGKATDSLAKMRQARAKRVEDLAADRDGDTTDLVDIPERWAELAWPDLRKLATTITGAPVTSKAQAAQVIDDEIAVRATIAGDPPADFFTDDNNGNDGDGDDNDDNGDGDQAGE